MKIRSPLMLIQMARRLLKLTVEIQRRLQLLKPRCTPTSSAGGVDKPPKRQRKLTSTVWDHYEFLLPDEEVTCFVNAKNVIKPILKIVGMEQEI